MLQAAHWCMFSSWSKIFILHLQKDYHILKLRTVRLLNCSVINKKLPRCQFSDDFWVWRADKPEVRNNYDWVKTMGRQKLRSHSWKIIFKKWKQVHYQFAAEQRPHPTFPFHFPSLSMQTFFSKFPNILASYRSLLWLFSGIILSP